jgi:hypothetical protein
MNDLLLFIFLRMSFFLILIFVILVFIFIILFWLFCRDKISWFIRYETVLLNFEPFILERK